MPKNFTSEIDALMVSVFGQRRCAEDVLYIAQFRSQAARLFAQGQSAQDVQREIVVDKVLLEWAGRSGTTRLSDQATLRAHMSNWYERGCTEQQMLSLLSHSASRQPYTRALAH